MKTSKKLIILINLLIAVSITGCIPAQRNATNGQIVFQSDRDGNFDLYVMNADGSEQRNLTNSPPSENATSNNVAPTSSPDGRKIAFQSNRDGNNEIYVINIESGSQLNLTKNKANDYSPSWSPNGKYIAFVSDRDSVSVNADRDIRTNNIYIVNTDGSNAYRLTKGNVTNSYTGISWSPDGKKLAFCLSSPTSSGGYFSNGINLLRISDSSMTRLTFDQSTNQCSPRWSPDGNRLAYLVLASMLSNIYVMNADGTDQVALSNDPSIYDTDPSWSPDGKYIIFSSRRDGSYHLYIMNADGSNQKEVTNGLGEETFPIWLPSP